MKTDPGQLESDDGEILPQGQLEVTCVEVSRLSGLVDISNIYCTFTVGKLTHVLLTIYSFFSLYLRPFTLY